MNQKTEQPSILQSQAASWQELICKLDGIFSARVVFSSQDVAEEIHVLANNSKNPKSITRDIQSAIMSVFGISVDYRIISIALIHPEMANNLRFRLNFTSLETKVSGNSIKIGVTLGQGEQSYCGEASCINTKGSRCRCVATATLAAVSCFTKDTLHFALDSTESVDLSGQPVILVSLQCIPDQKKLLGGAFVVSDTDTATVHATLAALNRKLELLADNLIS